MLIKQLETGHRVLAPDLIGYGRSGRWPKDLPLDPAIEAKVFITLADFAGEPVHLVGHSYGAMLLLEAARLLTGRVRSLTLIEPVSFHLLEAGGRPKELKKVTSVAANVTRAMDRGDARAAAGHYMGFWLGQLRWWLTPSKVKDSIVDTVDKVAKEFALLEQIDVDLKDYTAIDAPVRLIMGAKTRQPAKAVIDVLQRILPNVEVRVVPGAGHMSPMTHTDQVNALILEHISSNSG